VDRIEITEVAPRDGLQGHGAFIPTDRKLALIAALVAAGLRRIEATSFVSAKAVPQMADAAELIAGARRIEGAVLSALTPNVRGLERALQCQVDEVAVVLSATETMNRKNIGMSLEQAAQVSEQVLREARPAGVRTRAYVSVAFECPYEGPVAPAVVQQLAQRMLHAGAHEIVVADTIGAAAPGQVTRLCELLLTDMAAGQLALHLHDTRGLGATNAWAGIQAGVRRFDASAGGLGGCPFAPGAAGNLATEDLVLLCEGSGIETGVDAAALQEAVSVAGELVGRPIGGRSAAWARTRRARAVQAQAEAA
jgi:hydroxymethylglutaryl-CoA lyase